MSESLTSALPFSHLPTNLSLRNVEHLAMWLLKSSSKVAWAIHTNATFLVSDQSFSTY